MTKEYQVVAASMRQIEKQVIEEYAELHGLSFSAALRMIIRQWNETYMSRHSEAEKVYSDEQ